MFELTRALTEQINSISANYMKDESMQIDRACSSVPNFSLMLNVPDLYSELATKYAIPSELKIMPKIEREPALKSDPIHPNAQGYKLLAETIHQQLKNSGAVE